MTIPMLMRLPIVPMNSPRTITGTNQTPLDMEGRKDV